MAAKNKKTANMSAVRKALGKIRKYAVTARDHSDNQQIVEDAMMGIIETIDAALAVPPRNCDVSDAKTMYFDFGWFCQRSRGCTNSGCPLKREMDKGRYDQCQFLWALMPYKEDED